jgi:hypothetical protein
MNYTLYIMVFLANPFFLIFFRIWKAERRR